MSVPQGSFNHPHTDLSSHSPSLSVECGLKGLQLELSETCALCLSRLLSLICVPAGPHAQLPAAAAVTPSAGEHVHSYASSQPHLLLKLDCSLEEVNVFTLSNVAGETLITDADTTCVEEQG